jgi:2-keto-4-pentenoate hydratase/2-oxohepta-3-ene-1,7-dioic acid hydratase in catechol pathway
MKIIRYQNKSGKIGHAVWQEDGQTLKIQGDIFDNQWTATGTADVAKILAPVEPAAILCIGLNYRQHAAETGAREPSHPILFFKGPGALQNPGDPIVLPTWLRSSQVDYECELAVVIGRTCKNVRPEDALDYVLGYTCANDVSARDWQKDWGGSQWCRGKTFDTFLPLGPCLVTRESIRDPAGLGIRTILNGEVMQDSNTDDLIFDVPTLISFLSGSTTLMPGTVICTGTPQGVGMARKPPVWLKAGDEVTVEIDGIGRLTNPVIDEPLAGEQPGEKPAGLPGRRVKAAKNRGRR